MGTILQPFQVSAEYHKNSCQCPVLQQSPLGTPKPKQASGELLCPEKSSTNRILPKLRMAAGRIPRQCYDVAAGSAAFNRTYGGGRPKPIV